jgi:CRISPR-associated endonuclease Csn1
MHEETFYGLVRDPASGTDRFTTRKPLSAITKVKQLKGITDSRILRLIEERAHELGVDLTNKDLELPKNFFFEYSEEGVPTPTLYLPGGPYGRPIPVRKIRYRVESGNMKLRNKETNQYAEPGNNFMAVIIEDAQGNLREEIVSFWDAVTRQKDGHPPVVLLKGEKIMYNFQANEMYLLNLPEGTRWQDLPSKTLSKHLYRVQNFSSMYYVFRLHSASTLKYENEFVRVRSFSALIKVNPLPISSTYFGLNSD